MLSPDLVNKRARAKGPLVQKIKQTQVSTSWLLQLSCLNGMRSNKKIYQIISNKKKKKFCHFISKKFQKEVVIDHSVLEI